MPCSIGASWPPKRCCAPDHGTGCGPAGRPGWRRRWSAKRHQHRAEPQTEDGASGQGEHRRPRQGKARDQHVGKDVEGRALGGAPCRQASRPWAARRFSRLSLWGRSSRKNSATSTTTARSSSHRLEAALMGPPRLGLPVMPPGPRRSWSRCRRCSRSSAPPPGSDRRRGRAQADHAGGSVGGRRHPAPAAG